MSIWMWFVIGLVVLGLVAMSIRIVRQFERGVLLRFGKLAGTRNPGLNIIFPFIDQLTKVSLRVNTTVLEPQEVITKDNVTVKVDAVVYYNVMDPIKAVLNVENYRQAIIQLALTTLRSVLGQSELDELLSHRDQINLRLREIIDEQTEDPWGVRATRGQRRPASRKHAAGDGPPGRIRKRKACQDYTRSG
jgi:regulator of protease activity HflC (stomatin/prohibitin superfamily)